jgi:hypothetical protein
MAERFFKISLIFFVMSFAGLTASAQDATQRFPGEPKTNETQPRSIKEMLVKKRIEQQKKEHEELLKRGQEAIEISDQLEQSFAQNNQLSVMDRQKLEDLAGIVKKIRKEIGAEDDDEAGPGETVESETEPTTLQAAFKSLQSTTVKLVDELKKMTRFTISAVAIRSSNSLLRIVRFIRGK